MSLFCRTNFRFSFVAKIVRFYMKFGIGDYAETLLFQDEIVNNTYRMYELKRTVETHENEIARLKQEVVNMTKLADAAHAREQNAQETIENLRLNIVKLGQEIEQKNKQLAAERE